MDHLPNLILLVGFKATLILGMIAALLLVAGQRWPSSCSLGQRMGVLALLCLPVAVLALPTIGIPILSHSRPSLAIDDGRLAVQKFLDVSAFPGTGGGEISDTPSLPTSTAAAVPMRHPSLVTILSLCLAVAYGFIVVVLANRFVRAWLGLRRLKRASSLVTDSEWQTKLAHWSQVLRVARAVEVRISDEVSVPMTFGWRFPVILLPRNCVASCDETQRDAIVIHELTHILHGDFFWHALTQMTASLYWLHPLMWLVRRQEGVLCERICDAFCLHYLSRESYAQALVRIAGRRALRPAVTLGMAMAHQSSLRRRLQELESWSPKRCSAPNPVLRVLLGATASVVFGLIVSGTLTTRALAQETEKPSDSFAQAPITADSSKSKTDAAPIQLPDSLEGKVLDRQDNPVANARVVIRIERTKTRSDSNKSGIPERWTATTDGQGRYTISTGKPLLRSDDYLELKIEADGFAKSELFAESREVAKGSLPVAQLNVGRKVQGQVVGPDGIPITDAVVRFQANAPAMQMADHFDSGPVPATRDGKFSVTIPKAGKAAFAVYPLGFAPRIVDIPNESTDLGQIRVETGTSLTGRVVDKQGRGVAKTVVALESTDYRDLHNFFILICTAVKTDENGNFSLPPVRGKYKVTVTGGAADYSRQRYVNGATPPPIAPREIDLNGKDKSQELILREADSATVRGTVRWADGTPVPDVEIESVTMLWGRGVELASARTDNEGRYVLRLPVPLPQVLLSCRFAIQAPDGTYQYPKAIARGTKSSEMYQSIEFNRLTGDVEGMDWEVNPMEFTDNRSLIFPM